MMSPPPPSVPAGGSTHPLDTVLGDGQVLDRWFAVSHAVPAPSLADLYADATTLRAAITAELAPYGQDLPHVGASFLLGRTAWRVLGLLAVPYRALGVVPSLTATDVGMASLTVRTGEIARFRLRPGRFVAAAGTVAAGHGSATVVAETRALQDELRRRSAGLLDGLIEALRPWARRSVRNQRVVVDDALATALWTAGRATGGDASAPRPVRRSCCFAYQLDAGSLCASCPLHPDNRRTTPSSITS